MNAYSQEKEKGFQLYADRKNIVTSPLADRHPLPRENERMMYHVRSPVGMLQGGPEFQNTAFWVPRCTLLYARGMVKT